MKALEERQERILARLHELQLKLNKIVDETDVPKNILLTLHVRTCTASFYKYQ